MGISRHEIRMCPYIATLAIKYSSQAVMNSKSNTPASILYAHLLCTARG